MWKLTMTAAAVVGLVYQCLADQGFQQLDDIDDLETEWTQCTTSAERRCCIAASYADGCIHRTGGNRHWPFCVAAVWAEPECTYNLHSEPWTTVGLTADQTDHVAAMVSHRALQPAKSQCCISQRLYMLMDLET